MFISYRTIAVPLKAALHQVQNDSELVYMIQFFSDVVEHVLPMSYIVITIVCLCHHYTLVFPCE